MACRRTSNWKSETGISAPVVTGSVWNTRIQPSVWVRELEQAEFANWAAWPTQNSNWARETVTEQSGSSCRSFVTFRIPYLTYLYCYKRSMRKEDHSHLVNSRRMRVVLVIENPTHYCYFLYRNHFEHYFLQLERSRRSMSAPADQRIVPAGQNDERIDSYRAVAELHADTTPFSSERDEPAKLPVVPEATPGTATLQPYSQPPPQASTTGLALETPVGERTYNLHDDGPTSRPRYGSVNVGPSSGTVGVVVAVRRNVPSNDQDSLESNWEPDQVDVSDSPTACDKLMSRCCLFCLVIPFLLAAALMGLSVSTFAVMDHRVRENCLSVSCSLGCNNDSSSFFLDCGMVYTGGGLACLLGIFTIFTISLRICWGTKMLVLFLP